MPKRGIRELPWPTSRIFFDKGVQRVLKKHCLKFGWVKFAGLYNIIEFITFQNQNLENDEYAKGIVSIFIRYYGNHPILMAELLLAVTKAKFKKPVTKKDHIALIFAEHSPRFEVARDWDWGDIPTDEWQQVANALEQKTNQKNISVQQLQNAHAALKKERQETMDFWTGNLKSINYPRNYWNTLP